MTTYALAGNPNCGKTTLFNRLTRSHQHVGNWAGVTVEHKVGKYSKDKQVEIVDLPGIYALSPLSPDEIVARDYLLNGQVDLVLNVIDATNLERNLYLATQLLALDYPLVVALNMTDEAEARGIRVNAEKLQEILGCPVVPISAAKNQGIDELMQICKQTVGKVRQTDLRMDDQTEAQLDRIAELLDGVQTRHIRWYAVKALEGDYSAWRDGREQTVQACQAISQEYADLHQERADIAVANARYHAIDAVAKQVLEHIPSTKLSLSDKIDRYVTGKWTGIPIFIGVMFAVFFLSVQLFGTWTVDGLSALLERGQNALAAAMQRGQVSPWLISLTVDGILAGVGGILVYVPQIMVLFGLISALEACGYMARIAFLMDRIFRAIGLSGQSLIPMIIGCGCSVPGIMSARVVKNSAERRATVFLVPFIPCSAKLVLFAFFAGAVFGGNAFVATSMYFVSILVIIVGGLLLKGIRKYNKTAKDESFVMELPPYRVPKLPNVLHEMWAKGKSFVIKAGTVIFAASVILWFLRSFTWKMDYTEDVTQSILALIGGWIAPLFVPMGFGEWQYAVATLSGLAAKETVVVTLELIGNMSLTPVQAYAFMVFNLLCFPCMGAIATSFRELGSPKYGFAALGFQFVTAYVVATLFYQGGRLMQLHPAVFWSLLTGIILIAAGIIAFLVYRNSRKKGMICSGNCAGCTHACAQTHDMQNVQASDGAEQGKDSSDASSSVQ